MAYSSWVAALAGTAMLATSLPASAQVARFDRSLAGTAALPITPVQFGGDAGVKRLPSDVFNPGGRGGVRQGGFGRGFNGGLPNRGGFGNRGGFNGGGFANRGYGYRGDYRRGWRGGRGVAVGAGIAGLATGALIGGALASGPAYGYGYGAPAYVDPGYVADPDYGYAAAPTQVEDASGYCAQRYKSYDPASGTYLGYDGLRHPCP